MLSDVWGGTAITSLTDGMVVDVITIKALSGALVVDVSAKLNLKVLTVFMTDFKPMLPLEEPALFF